MLSLFSHGQLCDPMDCSPPGSSVRGISRARILEWAAISFSKFSLGDTFELTCPVPVLNYSLNTVSFLLYFNFQCLQWEIKGKLMVCLRDRARKKNTFRDNILICLFCKCSSHVPNTRHYSVSVSKSLDE